MNHDHVKIEQKNGDTLHAIYRATHTNRFGYDSSDSYVVKTTIVDL